MYLRWDIGLISEWRALIRNCSMTPPQPLQRRQNLKLLQEPPKKSLLQPLSWKKVSQVLKVKRAGQRGTGQWMGNIPGQTSKAFFSGSVSVTQDGSAAEHQGAPDDPIGLFLMRPQDGEVTVGKWELCAHTRG
jgi:hypothetical protein